MLKSLYNQIGHMKYVREHVLQKEDNLVICQKGYLAD